MFWPDLRFVKKGSKRLDSKGLVWLGSAAILVVATLSLGINTKSASADDNGQDDAHGRYGYAIGLWGDMPYSDIQAAVGVPNLIADMNSQELAFTAHDVRLTVVESARDRRSVNALDQYSSSAETRCVCGRRFRLISF
jgi:hypothetical protein